MKSSRYTEQRGSAKVGWIVFIASSLGVIALLILLSSIMNRRAERDYARLQMIQPVGTWEADNAKWGVNFPREFDSWESTKAMQENSRYGGSNFRDYLKDDPRLVVMWAGYPFAKDYWQARGHFHSLEDVNGTKRTNEKSPATCWTCKSPDVPRLIDQFGDPARLYEKKKNELTHEIKNPIGCADCHDPKTMALRISRPALREAFKRQGKDIAKATHQEMRTLVCAQCHVEYYFKDKKSNYLIFPWDKGLTADQMDEYYTGNGFSDWTHAISGARMIKMQHPDYELYKQGIHAFRGVACADCHMPYKSEGGVKFTDHQVRSPLYNVANSCGVCHRWSEQEVRSRVYSIQDKTREAMNRAEDAITSAHIEIGDAMKRGATDAELEKPRHLVSSAQLHWDYVAAANGMGFHAPQESVRILAKAIDYAHQCRIEVVAVRVRRGGPSALQLPDISSKEKAQTYIAPFVEAQKAKGELKPVEDKAVDVGKPYPAR